MTIGEALSNCACPEDLPPDPQAPAPPPVAPPGPVAQSVAIGFMAVYVVTLLLALVWAASNVRQIAPDSQAVVLRFGKMVRTQSAGLLIAWPRPFEDVILLPGASRQLSQAMQALPATGGISAASQDTSTGAIPPTATPYLTGDGNVVILDGTLTYHVTDAEAYYLAQDHIAPALNRVYDAAAVDVAAANSLNDFIVAKVTSDDNASNASNASDNNASNDTSASDAADTTITATRAEVRQELLDAVNARLNQLASQGSSLGITIDRIDTTAYLPPDAKLAFDAVLTATQAADQQVAAARTQAELRRQGSLREQDRLLSAAQAAALEAVTNAQVSTATISALESQENPTNRDDLLLRAYRDGAAAVLSRVGKTTLIDPNSGARLILPGRQ
jgi:regulator of protease activity HflC (stomatin/prohibitin superfamily)